MLKKNLGLHLLEVLEEEGILPKTKEDENAIIELLNKEIPYSINENGQVWSEGGIYVADVTDDEMRELVNRHWLQIICDEEDTTIYKIAKNANFDKSILYRVSSNNAEFENISLSTMNAIAKGLGITAYEFMSKYAHKFSDIGSITKTMKVLKQQISKDVAIFRIVKETTDGEIVTYDTEKVEMSNDGVVDRYNAYEYDDIKNNEFTLIEVPDEIANGGRYDFNEYILKA